MANSPATSLTKDMDVDPTSHRGTKRKASELQAALTAPPRIKPLAQDVINKIAAGEIIVAPVHALKELIENSVDAGTTSVEILVKEGGLKLLQITDNGHGIHRDDLPLLCERFTTSKLKAFEDLGSLNTYGFRGEALASISHIAHLTITTRTKDSSCAWRAHYSDGKLVPAKPGQSADPKATAGRQGTQTTVEDLFYNVPTRRRAFRSASEEYAKILDLVGRYSIHCKGVGFSCKKHGDSTVGLSVPAIASTVDRIRQVYGAAVANEIIYFEAADQRWGFESVGWISNANHSMKRMGFLLFINNRSVESSAIKKAVEQTYVTFLPKGAHPFAYLSLKIDPQRIDVNVHPTKREVIFLNEDEIIETICHEIRERLSKVDTSRTFMTQTLLPGAKIPTLSMPTVAGTGSGRMDSGVVPQTPSNQKGSAQRPYENNLVRTDSRARKITTMLPQDQRTPTLPGARAETSIEEAEYQYSDREPILCRLTSVKELRADVRANMHNELTDVFANHTFVGMIDERRRIAAIQGGVKLYLVDYGMVSNEYFYQVGLTDFGNFGVIQFDPPLKLRDLLSIGANYEKESAADSEELDWDEVVRKVEAQLISRREMLAEYFSLEIDETGDLSGIPLMIKGYTPSMTKLPQFLLRLGPHVDWNSEKGCFHSFLVELASFYTPEALPTGEPNQSEDRQSVAEEDAIIAARRTQLARVIETVLFPAFKARLVATKGLLNGVIEIADLKGLYRVFERC